MSLGIVDVYVDVCMLMCSYICMYVYLYMHVSNMFMLANVCMILARCLGLGLGMCACMYI